VTLANRRAVVTGGARGLGATTARGYAEAGMRVVVLDVLEDEGRALAESLGSRCSFLRCDVSSAAEVDAAFEAVESIMGGTDVLVAAAGMDRPGYAAEEIPPEVWERVMAVNASGTFFCNKAAVQQMAAAGNGGRIINFGSYAGIRGYAERAAYAAAKGAVFAWTRSVARAWGRHDVTVNAIAPVMSSEAAERYLAKLDDSAREDFQLRLNERVPIGGRLGDPEADLLPLMLFLAGDGARFITGQVFAVDGGMTMLGA
jgi:NAD(P)-dependent dehydrogenase (short-subunit alcohol dehydrogenase family)